MVYLGPMVLDKWVASVKNVSRRVHRQFTVIFISIQSFVDFCICENPNDNVSRTMPFADHVTVAITFQLSSEKTGQLQNYILSLKTIKVIVFPPT